VGESITGHRCENGVVVEVLAPHMYNLFMTTIDDGKIAMFTHACVDEHGTVKGRYEYNAFGLGIQVKSFTVSLHSQAPALLVHRQHPLRARAPAARKCAMP